ncbi:MAG: undecaprenyl diphosphate synthase family protein [Anaerolineales bacterium]|nr:undecaprenyl diphosphate synthase family protein [Anaerolineales bacterium]
MRLPKHIGIIPDGNRRWADTQGIPRIKGWDKGIDPGYMLFKLIQKAGIEEVTYYGYTMENARRPIIQRNAIINACIQGVKILSKEDADLLVVGNTDSKMFPKELLPYTSERKTFGKGGIKVNFLVNYGWEWDLNNLKMTTSKQTGIINDLKSRDVSKIDLIIRWGGWSRLSGFLPVQSIYADIFIVDELWPDFKPTHLTKALEWYSKQDITLGG